MAAPGLEQAVCIWYYCSLSECLSLFTSLSEIAQKLRPPWEATHNTTNI